MCNKLTRKRLDPAESPENVKTILNAIKGAFQTAQQQPRFPPLNH